MRPTEYQLGQAANKGQLVAVETDVGETISVAKVAFVCGLLA